MRLKAMFTIEAAYLIAYITVLVGSILEINFSLHDVLLSDAAKTQGGIRLYQAEAFFYDSTEETIDMEAIINSPLIDNDDFVDKEAPKVEDAVNKYFEAKKIAVASKISSTDTGKFISIKSNAKITRSGQRVVKLIGGLK